MPTISLKLSAGELECWKKFAEESGQGLSAFIRGKVNAAPVPPPEASPAVKSAMRQIERIAEHETAAKAIAKRVAGVELCKRCSRMGAAACDTCLAVVAKASESASETFAHLED